MAAGAEGGGRSREWTTGQMSAGSEAGQLCGQGEKGEKAAFKGPSPALVAERREFMAAPHTCCTGPQSGGWSPQAF